MGKCNAGTFQNIVAQGVAAKRELESVQASDPSPGRAEVDSLVEAGIANVKQDLEDSRSGRMLKGLGTLCQRITRVHQGTGLNRPLL